jgi:hypothetical protein
MLKLLVQLKVWSLLKNFYLLMRSLMAIDESTTIKTPTAKRTKNILKLAESAVYRRIMTGSPVTKNPLDLFTQCDFLSPWLLNFTILLCI